MTDGHRPWWRPRIDGLALRVAAFLTIALLPLGLIALHQTREYQRESEERAELSLLALTGQGAAGVRQAIEQALGAAEALGSVAGLLDDPATCSNILRRFAEERGRYGFVGLLPAEGPVTCSSAPAPFELDDRDAWADVWADPRPVVRARAEGAVTGLDVLIVAVPFSTGAENGEGRPIFVALSLPRDRLAVAPSGDPALRPLRLVTFNADGQVLTVQGAGAPDAALDDLLPRGRGLAREVTDGPRIFAARDARGTSHVYTVTPLIPGMTYALAIWSPEQAGRRLGWLSDSPLLFPLLMWATSLVVAFWAIHRLVIRRVARLGLRMRRFGRDRSLPDGRRKRGTPFELREIEDAFRQMAQSVLQDEARMENAFRERGVLLREVHHRVKNNLQLISSIISMQVRRMPEPRTRAILRRLQDRVLTLASIYRSLYTSPDMGDVNAAPVLRAVVEQELRGAPDRVEAVLDIEDLVLDPDKVVPLAFLTAEAVSNALSHAQAAEGRPSLSITLQRDGERATLRIANSLDGRPLSDQPDGGLGQHLIQAFAAQLGGPAEAEVQNGLYRLSVTFPISSQPAEAEAA